MRTTLLLILFVTTNGYSQLLDSTESNRYCSPFEYNQTQDPRLNKNYLKGYLTDTKNIISSPFHWKPKSWITFGSLGLASIALYSQDEKIKSWSQTNKNSITEVIADVVQPIGNGRYIIAAPIIFYSYGLITKKHQPKRLGLITLESIVLVGGFSKIVKHTLGRKRPDETNTKNDWSPFKFNFQSTSFFSGHSSLAFMTATILSEEFKSKKAIGYVSYSLAGLTTLSRIHDNRHWASDVFFGAAAGYFITKAIMKRHKINSDQNLSILPFYNREHSGLQIGYRF